MATKVSLKLLIDKKNQKVLVAESGKDFVDFLFNLLTLPLGTVIRLLTKHNMVGSLGKLYGSTEELSEAYLQQDKCYVLNPTAPFTAARGVAFLLEADEYNDGYDESATRKVYTCPLYHFVAERSRIVCPQCKSRMRKEVPFVDPAAAIHASSNEGGFVKGVVTYMVMDDLEVKPMPTISTIALLNKLRVQEIGALEEKVVDLGMPEGLKLLKASLHSNEVLTSVFLGSMVA